MTERDAGKRADASIRVRHPRMRSVVGVALSIVAVIAMVASCAPAPPAMTPPRASTSREGYRVLAGLEQVYVIGAKEGDQIEVSAPSEPTRSGVADRLGSLAIRDLTQGRTYTVTNESSGSSVSTTVLVADQSPPRSFYEATTMREGMNYIPMRDGITVAATVRPPLGQSMADGPFPTVIEYSGYQIAAPDEPLWSKLGTLVGLEPDPLAPSGSTDVSSLLMRLAGFAVVSLQMRGSGCSGGEADLFDLPSRYDGYDAVETVAAQDWVANGKVGMVGISFSGFSQIATAATEPPHLAAIAPLSFVGSLYDLGHPGGIFNNGFSQSWLKERQENARPAPDPGALPYANYMVQTDKNCRDNQRLRLQTRDAIAMVKDQDLMDPIYTRRDFSQWMSQIKVPTFASLQFNDEETSPYAILSASSLLSANPNVWLNVSNGHHRDAVSPDTLSQLFEFLDIYVGRRVPQPKLLVNLLSDVVFGEGSAKPPWPEIAPPLEHLFDWPVEEAQRQFEAKPRVRVLLGLQEGANEGQFTGEQLQFEADEFPVAGSTERTWYLGADGALLDDAGGEATATYRPDPSARPAVTGVPGKSPSDPPTGIKWDAIPESNGVGFVTAPLGSDLLALGSGAANIRISSSAKDTDLGLTISEVRPDGQEKLVAIGVQRASMRHTDPSRSTSVKPAYTLDRHEYLDGSTVDVPVQILPIGHVFKKGSRLRLSIHAVGGDSERWAFDSVDPSGGSTVNTVHLGGARPSSLTLTTLDRSTAGFRGLDCPSMGMPCRTYEKNSNGG